MVPSEPNLKPYWQRSTRAALITFQALAIAFIVLPAACIAFLPRLTLIGLVHDAYVPMEAGWRVANGQTPHIDFHSPVGPVYPAVHGLAALAFGADPRIVAWGALFGGFLILALAAPVVLRRMPLAAGLWLLAFLFLLAVTPRYLESFALAITWIGIYNNWCWCLLGVIVVGTVLPASEPKFRRTELLDGIIIGLAITLLVWLKLTYAVVAVTGSVAALIIQPAARRVIFPALLTLFAGSALLLTPVGLAYLRDIKEAAGIVPSFGQGDLIRAVRSNAGIGLTLVASLIALPLLRSDMWRIRDVLLVWTMGTIPLTLQNDSKAISILPLLLALTLFAAAGTIPVRWRESSRTCIGILAITLPLAFFSIREARSIIFAFELGAGHHANVADEDITKHASFSAVLEGSGHQNQLFREHIGKVGSRPPSSPAEHSLGNGNHAIAVRDGLAFLSTHARKGESIAYLGFSDPFSILRGVAPPRGTNLWNDHGRTWLSGVTPLNRLVGDADLVLQPTFAYDWAQSAAMTAALAPLLQSEWRVRAQTNLWILWERKPSPGAG